eukprot:12502780-Alexandrium_andersonii.AAC.1
MAASMPSEREDYLQRDVSRSPGTRGRAGRGGEHCRLRTPPRWKRPVRLLRGGGRRDPATRAA